MVQKIIPLKKHTSVYKTSLPPPTLIPCSSMRMDQTNRVSWKGERTPPPLPPQTISLKRIIGLLWYCFRVWVRRTERAFEFGGNGKVRGNGVVWKRINPSPLPIKHGWRAINNKPLVLCVCEGLIRRRDPRRTFSGKESQLVAQSF